MSPKMFHQLTADWSDERRARVAEEACKVLRSALADLDWSLASMRARRDELALQLDDMETEIRASQDPETP